MYADPSQITILVVDDNPGLRQLLVDTLEKLGGYRVLTAEDGEQGLIAYFEERPHCMVIDIMMPKLDGFQLLRVLRGDPNSADTPLILLTALPEDKGKYAGILSGADQYLVKPVRPVALLQAIQTALITSNEQREQRMRNLANDIGSK